MKTCISGEGDDRKDGKEGGDEMCHRHAQQLLQTINDERRQRRQ